jgi:hypothetical protein
MIGLQLTPDEAVELYDVLEDALSEIVIQPVRDPEDRESIDARAAFVESMMDRVVNAINAHTIGRN